MVLQEVRTKQVPLSAAQPSTPLADKVVDVTATFVDTPGQEIFYRMRNYGASAADVALLVLAVDEAVSQAVSCNHLTYLPYIYMLIYTQ